MIFGAKPVCSAGFSPFKAEGILCLSNTTDVKATSALNGLKPALQTGFAPNIASTAAHQTVVARHPIHFDIVGFDRHAGHDLRGEADADFDLIVA